MKNLDLEHKIIELENKIIELESNKKQLLFNKDQELSLIYDTVGDVVFALEVKENREYTFISVNQRFLDATGLINEDIIGKNVREVIPEPSINLVLENYEIAIKENKIVQWEETTPYPSGLRIGEVSIAPVIDADGNCSMLVGSVHDITDRINNTIKLKESFAAIEKKNEELREFNHIISHDLQEPINTIISFTTLLSEEISNKSDLTEIEKKSFSYISEASHRIKSLIKSMLEYKMIGESSELEMVTVDCNQIVQQVIDDLTDSIRQANVSFNIGNLPTLTGYDVELRILFQNLISNAIKFRKFDRALQVDIYAEVKDEIWQFVIKDNGIGIEEQYLERIFGMLQRLNNKDKYEGNGIGLAYCKKIIELHNGKIWVESELDKGSSFYFTIK